MQIYKVFIENRPVFFEINSNSKEELLTVDEIKLGLTNFIGSEYTELYIEIESKNIFDLVFEDYKYVEAAGGLVEQKGKYLFIKRHDIWDIPKGKLENNETPKEGAVREIMEECGISEPKIIRHLVDTWHTYEMNGKLHLKKTYWYLLKSNDSSKKLTPQLDEGITEAIYLPKKAFDMVKSNTYESIKDVIRALNNK